MTSPLSAIRKVQTEYNVTEEKQLHRRQQLAYVETQVQEQQMILNRAIVDLVISRKNYDEASAETKSSKAVKVASFENDIRQLSDGIVFYIELAKELRAELEKENAAV